MSVAPPYAAERDLPLALRPWRPFRQTTPYRADGSPAPLEEHEAFHANAHYLVHRLEMHAADGTVFAVHLSLRTVENDTRHDWRDMLRIKDELCGPEWEAVELYPAHSRVVDTANQYHLWCFPPGSSGHHIMSSIGFHSGRAVYDQDDPGVNDWLASVGQPVVQGHKQRPTRGKR